MHIFLCISKRIETNYGGKEIWDQGARVRDQGARVRYNRKQTLDPLTP